MQLIDKATSLNGVVVTAVPHLLLQLFTIIFGVQWTLSVFGARIQTVLQLRLVWHGVVPLKK